MSIVIPDDLLKAAKMTEAELKLEVAALLYQQQKISSGKARRFAGLSLLEFQREIAKRGLHVNYDREDFQADIETLHQAGEL